MTKNSDQSKTQDSDVKQLELQLTNELNQLKFSMVGYSAASAPKS